MGIALVVSDVNFESSNLGQVEQDVPLTGIVIASGVRKGNIIPLNITYIPELTNQKGISWDISGDGADFVSISKVDNNISNLTILEGANANNITVRASSISNPGIVSNALTFEVTYEADLTVVPLYISKIGQFVLPHKLGGADNNKWTLCINAICLDTYKLSQLDAMYYQETNVRNIGFGFYNPDRNGERNIGKVSGAPLIAFDEVIAKAGGYESFKNGVDGGLMAIRRDGSTLSVSSDGEKWHSIDYTWVGYGDDVKIGLTSGNGEKNINCTILFDKRSDNDAEVKEFFATHKK